MKYPVYRPLQTIIGTAVIAAVLVPILLVISLATYLASIPSRVGRQFPIENWIYQGMGRILDLDLMSQFRDDIFHRIRPHIEPAEDYERWWVIREMDLSIERTDSALQSGEYILVIVLAFGSVFIDSSLYGVPISVFLTFLAVGLSGMILVRITILKVLVFRSEVHLEEPTHDLIVRMAFNRGPFSNGASIGIALLTLLIGITRGQGYKLGLDIVEWFAAKTHPEDPEKWHADK